MYNLVLWFGSGSVSDDSPNAPQEL
jgi:hypothetical protein